MKMQVINQWYVQPVTSESRGTIYEKYMMMNASSANETFILSKLRRTGMKTSPVQVSEIRSWQWHADSRIVD